MSAHTPLSEFDLGAGARLTLYADRIVHQATDAMETVPLAQLASVRVAFERDALKLNWAVVMLVVALALALVSSPLQGGAAALAASVREQAGRESMDALLVSSFSALAALGRLLMPVAALLAGFAAVLLGFFWYGATTLTLSFAATERGFAVRGRNPALLDFADAVALQLAGRRI